LLANGVTMHIDVIPNRNSPPAILVRESYREDGKVRKRTLANISNWDPEVIAGLRVLFKGGHASSAALEEQFSIERSLPHGHVAAVLGTLRGIGLHADLERKSGGQRALAIALIAGRILFPGSKLALSRQLSPATATSTLGEELGLGEVDEHDLYGAMRWLLERQEKIEARLAGKHMPEDTAVLYDLTSTYYEGSTCPLAEFGHSRDKKKGKRQINIGLLCNSEGCPVAVEVFPGSTGDPATVASQIRTLRERFGLERVVVVGDRGMLTNARIDELREDETNHYGWISALRSGQIRKLANSGDLQLELFDETDLAEISSEEHFPGERLVVCRNPLLAAERERKRNDLLDATEAKLQAIGEACRRVRAPYHGKDRIARRVERECARYRMLKHFKLSFTETSLEFGRDEEAIAREASLDGIYVVRAGRVSKREMNAEKLVETYKSLSQVERAFRAMKTTVLNLRPIFHREEDMVRAHVLVCMLACNVQWHLEKELKASLFNDEVPGGAPRKSPVAKARRSERAQTKVADKKTEDGRPAHSFATLLEDLATLCRITIRPAIKGAATFNKLTEATPVQAKALAQLGVTPKAIPACSQ
jgi:transposase